MNKMKMLRTLRRIDFKSPLLLTLFAVWVVGTVIAIFYAHRYELSATDITKMSDSYIDLQVTLHGSRPAYSPVRVGAFSAFGSFALFIVLNIAKKYLRLLKR